MKKIEENDLLKIEGGAIKASAVIAVSCVVTFIIGLVDGIIRPYKCRS